MAQRNTFLDGDLSDRTSLIHLLDKNDSEDNNEAHVIKHSPYYGETDFSKLLVHKAGFSILSLNIQSVNAKFDEFQLFVNRMNLTNPISVICRGVCRISQGGGPNFGILDIHAAKRHVASSEAASLC